MASALNNLGVKGGAIGVALLLWLHVVTEKTYTYVFHASLNPTHLAENLIIANELPEHFQVKIRGKGKRLFWLMFSDVRIILDLQDTILSKTRFRINDTDVIIPRDLDVTVVEIVEPDYVDIDIDRLVEKQIPVRPMLEVVAAERYVTVGSVKANPDTAMLSGPRRFVDRVDTLFTQHVTLQRAKNPVRRELSVVRPEGVNITVKPQKILIEVDIQKLKKRVVNDIPVTLVHAPSNKKVALDSPTISLTIEGGEVLLDTLRSEDFLISVDYRQARHGSTTALTPIILTPPNVTWIDAQPRVFHIVDSES